MSKRMITSFSEAVDLLCCPHSISNRKEDDYRAIDALDHEFGSQVRQFFQQWPMYIDGDQHKKLRGLLLQVLRKYQSPDRDELCEQLTRTLNVDHIGLKQIEECVLLWHSYYFGIELADDAELMRRSEPLISLVIFHDYSLLEPAKDAMNFINSFFEGRKFSENGLVAQLLDAGVGSGTVMNFLVDSYTPMIAGTSSVLFHAFNADPSETKAHKERRALVQASLNRLPPFRYINRIVSDTDNNSNWVGVDVLACNRDLAQTPTIESRRKQIALTFGTGKHMCLGLNPALELFDDLVLVASRLRDWRGASVVGEICDSEPVCTVKDVLVKLGDGGLGNGQ